MWYMNAQPRMRTLHSYSMQGSSHLKIKHVLVPSVAFLIVRDT